MARDPVEHHSLKGLRDAIARLRNLMRRARDQGAQRIAGRGRDLVVVVDATSDRLREQRTGARLVHALRQPPLKDVTFDRASVSGPVRVVEL